MKVGLLYLVLINLITLVAYARDKHLAKKHKYRIPEKTLIGLAVIGGSIGALLGMYLFHHKTKKPKFYVGVPAIMILEIVCLVLIMKKF